ncbi:glycosyltransferase family 4 protein [Achromobacter marplatensis]|uniref:glycosyltransferase family 4 protein n=1 Tax=Achromobacter marplatensis TaxID=470868 RepID=UPI000277DC13|nr:glycosyltransferase family 4 protein [Achromobacter marplatensis]EJO30189.1 glycosyl transferase group 1 [Achromobacter marplatensis]
MKILYTNYHKGDGGGHTTYLTTLIQHLGPRYHVTLAAPQASRLYRETRQAGLAEAMAVNYSSRIWHTPALVSRLADIMAAGEFDIVHVNGSLDHRCAMLARMKLAGPGPRIVYTKHDNHAVSGLGSFLRASLATDHVIAVSEDTHRKLQRSAYARRPISTVKNGVDTDRFQPYPQAAGASVRSSWPVRTAGRLVIGSNAGTAPYKNWLHMVQAVALLPAPLREQVLVAVAGQPPTVEQQARVLALGMADHVYYAGHLSDVRPFVAALDIGFVLSTRIETISFACREMMAMGKPVMVSRYAGLPENITEGVDGWVVDPGSPAAIAQCLAQILTQRERLRAMGQAARAKSLAEFGVQRFVGRTLDIYDRVLATNHQRAGAAGTSH